MRCRCAVFALALWLVAVALDPGTGRAAAATSCDAASRGVLRHLPLPGAGGKRLAYFGDRPLDVPDPSVTSAVVFIHGTKRNASEYFADLVAAARSAGARGALLIAPWFPIVDDAPDNDDLHWDANRDWKEGGLSTGRTMPRVTSFEAMDALVEELALSGRFPNLRGIVIVGHSAGGQYVQRLAAGSRVGPLLPVSVRYVVMNPSSYLYMNAQRPVDGAPPTFAIPATDCPEYDDYRYGLERLNEHMAALGAARIRAQYAARDVRYLLGALDSDPDDEDLDTSCPAMLQGRHRLERGLRYFAYLERFYGVQPHALAVVDGVGHSAGRMLRSPSAVAVVFHAWE